METKPHILVVDDEADIRETVQEYLELNGLKVTPLDGGGAMREFLDRESADLVLLDINMPGEDGLSLARFLRANSSIGVIMLTAAGDVVDRVVGLEVGADDYLPKPVDLRELLARVRAVLRRREAQPAQSVPERTAEVEEDVEIGRHRLNVPSRRLLDETGDEVPLTSMEFDLLKAFVDHPNRTLSRDQLLDLAHSRNWEPFDRSIDIRIARIRQKIEADPSKPEIIKTVRGVGYLYVKTK